jgi:hypothetical protein
MKNGCKRELLRIRAFLAWERPRPHRYYRIGEGLTVFVLDLHHAFPIGGFLRTLIYFMTN